MRVWQLRDRKAVDAADYQTLLRNADTILKDDVLASKSLLVMPKGSVTLNMPMDEDAQFVAVVGLFNRPDQKDNRWRLVDGNGQLRGQGTELRTDVWGTLRAGKGLFVAADAQAKAQGEALDMDAALKEIDMLNQQLQQLEMATEKAQALKGDVDSQIQMFEQRLKSRNEAVLFSAP